MKHLIWDWNGTLIDDIDVACACVNDILRAHGQPPIDKTQYHAYMEMPIRRFYANLFDLAEVPFSRIAEDFNRFYAVRVRGASLARGAIGALERFAAAGWSQRIVSSASSADIRRDLARLGVGDYFAEIVGSDNLFAEGKIAYAKRHFAEQQIVGADALVVGDTLHDAELAAAVGARCVLVAGGHQSARDLAAAGVPVLASLEELHPEDFLP